MLPDVSGLNPEAETYVDELVERLHWDKHRSLLQYAWQLRRALRPGSEAATAAVVQQPGLPVLRGGDGAMQQLSTPALCVVPWPSFRPPDDTRYPERTRAGGLSWVHMFGRAQLADIREQVRERQRLFLFGVEGVGKSRLLAMLALACMAEHVADPSKPPVCFIPHLGDCVARPLSVWEALVQACIHDPAALLQLAHLESLGLRPPRELLGELLGFARQHKVLVIADQHNAVEYGQHAVVDRGAQIAVASFIASLGKGALDADRVVFAASANQSSVNVLTEKQDSTTKVRMAAVVLALCCGILLQCNAFLSMGV